MTTPQGFSTIVTVLCFPAASALHAMLYAMKRRRNAHTKRARNAIRKGKQRIRSLKTGVGGLGNSKMRFETEAHFGLCEKSEIRGSHVFLWVVRETKGKRSVVV